jgi:hypothetical protein
MCLTTKESLFALIILVVISILLFIRNIGYDRLYAALFLVVSLIQVVEYLFHAHKISSNTGGKLIFLILWLQVVVLAIGLQIYFATTFTAVWAVIFILVFVGALYYASFTKFKVSTEFGHLVWSKDGKCGNILGNYGILYLIGLFVPFLIIQYYNGWRNTGVWILFIALILSYIFVRMFYPKLVFSSLWCYSAVGIAFVAWLIGAFYEHKN